MAPEQAAGQASQIGPWTDVHALGVVLYEAIVGRTPFGGHDMASTIRSVIADEPPPLRGAVPRDVETILARCLEKDPSRRYKDGAEVAEEIDRFLQGQAIPARPASLADRLLRRMRRNPLVSALASVVVVAALLTVGVAWKARRDVADADARTREARDLAADEALKYLAEGGSDLLDAALARRAVGDLDGCIERTSRLRSKVEELKSIAPHLAEPWFYEGRIERTQGHGAAAIAAFDRAIDLAARPAATEGSRRVLAPSRYQRGVLRAEAYQRDLETRRGEMVRSAAAAHPDQVRAPDTPETEEVLACTPELEVARGAAIADLRQAAPGLPAAASEAASAIIAILEDRTEEGRAALEAAVGADPFLEEAYSVLAGDAESRQDWEEASDWFAKGHEADRGCLEHLLGRARVESFQATASSRAEGVWRAPLDRAAEALDEATRLAPDSAEAWKLRACLESVRVDSLRVRGLDRSEASAAARAAAEKALSLNERSAIAVTVLACLEQDTGHERIHQGADPSEDLGRARALFERARDIDPDDPLLLCNLASVHRSLGEWLEATGGDPGEAYREAMSIYEEAIRVSPRFLDAAYWLGETHSRYGAWLDGAGRDPTSEYEAACTALRRALALGPDHGPTLEAIVTVLWRLGRRSLLGGVDPREGFAPALDALAIAEDTSPGSTEVAWVRAKLMSDVAEALLEAGEDPSAVLKRAAEALDRAMSLKAGYASAILYRGMVHAFEADLAGAQGKDPTPLRREAIAWADRALRLAPGDFRARESRANLLASLGEGRFNRGEDAEADLVAAMEAYDGLLRAAPRRWDLIGDRAGVHLALARNRRDHGRECEGEYRKAIEDGGKAAERAPRIAKGPSMAGWAHLELAYRAEREGKAEPEYAAALESFERALAIAPRSVDVMCGAAAALCGLAECAARKGEDAREQVRRAIGLYDRAVEARPGAHSVLSDRALAHRTMGALSADRGEDPSKSYQAALADWTEALRTAPGYAHARANHADLLWSLGRVAEAVADLEWLVKAFPEAEGFRQRLAEAHLSLARAAARAGEHDEAFARLDSAIQAGLAGAQAVRKDSDLGSLHDDPRWEEVLRRLDSRK